MEKHDRIRKLVKEREDLIAELCIKQTAINVKDDSLFMAFHLFPLGEGDGVESQTKNSTISDYAMDLDDSFQSSLSVSLSQLQNTGDELKSIYKLPRIIMENKTYKSIISSSDSNDGQKISTQGSLNNESSLFKAPFPIGNTPLKSKRQHKLQSKYERFMKEYRIKVGWTKAERDLMGYNFYAWKLRVSKRPLSDYLPTARHALRTKDWQNAREEAKQLKLFQKIEQLKLEQLWSLKQIMPHQETPRQKTHQDILIDEMKWMREDFKQEKRLKLTICYQIGQMVLQWHRTAEKSTICIRIKSLDESKSKNNDSEITKNDMFQKSIDIVDQQSISVPLEKQSNKPNSLLISFFGSSISSQQVYIPEHPVYSAFDELNHNYHNPVRNAVPISKFMTEPYFMSPVLASTRNQEEKSNVWRLELHNDYTFPQSDERSSPLKLISPSSNKVGSLEPWSREEDELLVNYAKIYSNNWSLISETISSFEFLAKGYRSKKDCYDRLCAILNASTDGIIDLSSEAVSASKNTLSDDRTKRFNIFLNRFEHIHKHIQEKRKNPSKASKVSKKINLSAHETHLQTQVQAGMIINGPTLGPLELSAKREKKDREMRHASGSAAMGRQMPIISKQFSNTQYRPAVQNRPVNNTQMLDTAQTSPFVHDLNSPPKPVPNLLPATNKYASGGLPQNVNYTNNPTNQPVRMPFMGMPPQGMNQDQMKAMMAHNMLARGVSNPYGVQMDPTGMGIGGYPAMNAATAQRFQQMAAQAMQQQFNVANSVNSLANASSNLNNQLNVLNATNNSATSSIVATPSAQVQPLHTKNPATK